MGDYSKFYHGAEYGFEPKYDEFLGMEYRTPASMIGIATDPRTANQIRMVSERINNGLNVVEVSMLQPNIAEAIPNQHLDELNRLKKLVGAELTLHGPLVEPTGIQREGWDESQRVQAERQMWTSLERAHRLDPDGNLVVTFHSSHGLPEPETRVLNENAKEGEPKEIVKEMIVINEMDGKMAPITPKKNYLLDKTPNPKEELAEQNKKAWESGLSQVSHYAMQGKDAIEAGLNIDKRLKGEKLFEEDQSTGLMKKYWEMSKTEEGRKFMEKEIFTDKTAKAIVEKGLDSINHGDIYVKEAYTNLQENFNKAWDSIKRKIDRAEGGEKRKAEEDFQRLKEFRNEISEKKDILFDSFHIQDLAEEVQKGVNVLNNLAEPPPIFRPLRDFAVEQASETFANLAFKSYEKFKDTSPIISIENPPAGMGLCRADDLRSLIKESRGKFAEKAVNELGLSKSEANEQAEKLIGATWDLGHINMIRKYGYTDKEIVAQTKEIGPFIKHVHLSDNFGMEHTELPMGMGNVPTKEHMKLIDQYNKKVKKIIEAGDWYQHFQTAPVAETLSAFGSPIYSMQMAPYWNTSAGMSGGYFSGYGLNPDIHHSMYGAGFSNLPVELGGQMAGRSRMSGAPME